MNYCFFHATFCLSSGGLHGLKLVIALCISLIYKPIECVLGLFSSLLDALTGSSSDLYGFDIVT